MKKILTLTIGLLILVNSYSTSISNPPIVNAKQILIPIGNTGKSISLFDLSRISKNDLQALTGKKMNFFERISFKSGQKKLKKCITDNGDIQSKKLKKYLIKNAESETGFHAVGFILGFLLQLIGVLIAYVMNDDADKKNRVKWAWIGFATSLVLIWGLYFAVIASIY